MMDAPQAFFRRNTSFCVVCNVHTVCRGRGGGSAENLHKTVLPFFLFPPRRSAGAALCEQRCRKKASSSRRANDERSCSRERRPLRRVKRRCSGGCVCCVFCAAKRTKAAASNNKGVVVGCCGGGTRKFEGDEMYLRAMRRSYGGRKQQNTHTASGGMQRCGDSTHELRQPRISALSRTRGLPAFCTRQTERSPKTPFAIIVSPATAQTPPQQRTPASAPLS